MLSTNMMACGWVAHRTKWVGPCDWSVLHFCYTSYILHQTRDISYLTPIKMSVDIDWKTLTGGPDGEALAETIREFVHQRFQQINWPKLIRSVEVHGFDFGTVAPQIVLKDICEPLPEFYESQEDDESQDEGLGTEQQAGPGYEHRTQPNPRPARSRGDPRRPSEAQFYEQASNIVGGRAPFLGGTSNRGYFNMPLSAGFSGTNTPLAAVAGAHFPNGMPVSQPQHRNHSDSFSSVSPASWPTSREHNLLDSRGASAVLDGSGTGLRTPQSEPIDQDRSPEDLQVVFHATYAGDVSLSMTTEVFLDFPMPSFVGIPLKLKITGVTFNGVGILAHIKKRAHLSFLSQEDAEALVGDDVNLDSPEENPESGATGARGGKVGGLLEEIKIESEMGENSEGKQVLKNVGKIEKFVLEQVQRIFEEEFVYPSFWTFLV